MQEVLFYYGYYQGSIDGIYGPLTENAIEQLKNKINELDQIMNESDNTYCNNLNQNSTSKISFC